MSAQFGRCNFTGQPVDAIYLEKVKSILEPFAPHGTNSLAADGVSILYCALQTTEESKREKQPYVSIKGSVITWDGRLDNRGELIGQLGSHLNVTATDVEIVSAAYDQWGVKCFAKLIGDWAVSIYSRETSSVVLAKDFAGIRHLYYSVNQERIIWSTILDPLVLLSDNSLALSEAYISGWFSQFPASHFTPYVNIHSVPPSSFVVLSRKKKTESKYWDFDPNKRIRYSSDAEYEDHFRVAFTNAVKRRLRANVPILAELSGGMDSSSVVCVADQIFTTESGGTPRLDTVSYFSNSEPHWDERPYFSKVEEKRGRPGCHIEIDSDLKLWSEPDHFVSSPDSVAFPNAAAKAYAEHLKSGPYQVVLSGIGGDEATGGVPTPIPELTDLLARARLRRLAHQLKIWALNKREPWIHLLVEAASRFCPLWLTGGSKNARPPEWLTHGFVHRNHIGLRGSRTRLNLSRGLPSFQLNLLTLDFLRRQLACSPAPCLPAYEKRYPYLDRCLLEFLYAIPREQLVRPGQRRSLMRRALKGIVPDEVLNRRRKAFAARSVFLSISAEWPALLEVSRNMAASRHGIVDSQAFLRVLEKARDGQQVPITTVIRTLGIEAWLRSLGYGTLVGVNVVNGASGPVLGRVRSPAF